MNAKEFMSVYRYHYSYHETNPSDAKIVLEKLAELYTCIKNYDVDFRDINFTSNVVVSSLYKTNYSTCNIIFNINEAEYVGEYLIHNINIEKIIKEFIKGYKLNLKINYV